MQGDTTHAKRLDVAVRLAREAGDISLEYFRREDLKVERKGDDSPVTIADRRAEEHLRAGIATAFPDDAILGEEFPDQPGTSGFRWILDPIDGTKSFICGVPLFGTIVGLIHQGRPLLGLIDQPISRERWLGVPGGAMLNGRAVTTAPCPELAQARIFTTGTDYHDDAKTAAYQRLAQACGVRRFSADCYAFGLVAIGSVDIAIEANLNEFDVAGVVPVVEQAGGIITDWQGAPLRFDGQRSIPTVIACGDRALHAQALALLNG